MERMARAGICHGLLEFMKALQRMVGALFPQLHWEILQIIRPTANVYYLN
jgi:hypothetical protein